jgi:N-acetylglucosaminyl-diphospho-decaprenol L-rhamnosyltransferase
MSRDPELSILIVSWNCRDLIGPCLQSIEDAPDAVTREIIVVDNGSLDGTPDYVREFRPDVRVIALGENHGFGAANNIAFGSARGQFILLLNPDTLVRPGMMARMIATLRDDDSIGCVGAKHYNPDGSLQWSMDDFPSLLNEAVHYTDVYRLPFLTRWLRRSFPRWSDHDVECDVSWVNGACMMVPRSVYAETGGFDDYFFLFAEELDWCLRIWRAGRRVRFLPDAVVVHKLGGTFDPQDWRRLAMLYQSSLRYYRRHLGWGSRAGLQIVIRINALVRLTILASAYGLRRITGRQLLPESTLQIVVQHEHPLPARLALRLWWKILTLRSDTRLRPVAPSRIRRDSPR